jgi:hypothetical protein
MNTLNERHINPIVQIPAEPRVRVEPELEFMLEGHSALERLEMARKFDRWSRQIRMQLTVCLDGEGNYMPPKNTQRIPEPRWFFKLQNN